MSDLPDPAKMPAVDDLGPGEVRELAEAYLDLLRLMTEALHECTSGYGFFSWSGQGYAITGHPPDDLVAAIRATSMGGETDEAIKAVAKAREDGTRLTTRYLGLNPSNPADLAAVADLMGGETDG